MRNVFSIILFFLCESLLFGEQVQLKGNALFDPSGNGHLTEKGGIITQKAGENTKMYIHNVETPKTDTVYTVKIAFTATAGMMVRTYIENGTNGWQNASGGELEATGGTQETEFPFTLAKPVKGPSYIVISAKGAGEVTIHLVEISSVSSEDGIPDGDFKHGGKDWKLEKNAQVVSDKLVVTSPSEEDTGVAISPEFRLKPNTKYRLTYESCGKKLNENQMMYNFKAILKYKTITPTLYVMGTSDQVWIQTFSSPQTKSYEFRSSPKKSTATLQLLVQGPGCVEFSNFKLEEVPEATTHGKIELDIPFYQGNGVFESAPSKKITGKLVDISEKAISYELKLTDANGQVKFSQKGKIDGTDPKFSFDVPEQPGAVEELHLSLLDKEGKEIGHEEMPIHNYPRNSSEVTFRDDGVTLVNGKPFFMIGHWWFTRRGDHNGKTCDFWYNSEEDAEQDMKFLREAGFNTLLLGHERFQRLDLAQKNGLMALIENKTLAEKESWQKEIKSNMGHPALLGYFGRDEAMVFGLQVDDLMEQTKMIKEIDPYHPLFYNEAPCGTAEEQKKYTPTCDVTGRDIYPIGMTSYGHGDQPDKTMNVVGVHTDICHESVSHNKPVWMILQACSWDHLLHPQEKYEEHCYRYPTYSELRYMAYDAILHGATGILYHYLGYTVNVPDAFWSSLRKVTLELEYMVPILTSRTVKQNALSCKDKAVRYIAKQVDGINYYIIANESPEPRIAIFENVTEAKLNCIHSSVPIYTENGRFTLELESYGVVILSENAFPDEAKLFKPESYVPYHKQPVIK